VTVYVDNPLARLGRMVMCHMVADTEAELHAMAKLIGVDRKHYQADASTPHYDICKQMRAIAVGAGAVEVNRRGMVAVIRRLRELRSAAKPEPPTSHNHGAGDSSSAGAAVRTGDPAP
jgi:hypothetical protein